MERLFVTLVLTLFPLLLSSCTDKEQSSADTGKPEQSRTDTDLLLAAALANPTTASRPACVVLPGLGSEGLFTRQIASGEGSTALAEAGYYQVRDEPFSFAFTQKYKDLLAHSSNPQADNTRLCLGEARVVQMQNVVQVNPDKVTAEGATEIRYEPWATEEVQTLFGPDRNEPAMQPIRMVCLRDGSWSCEKR